MKNFTLTTSIALLVTSAHNYIQGCKAIQKVCYITYTVNPNTYTIS